MNENNTKQHENVDSRRNIMDMLAECSGEQVKLYLKAIKLIKRGADHSVFWDVSGEIRPEWVAV